MRRDRTAEGHEECRSKQEAGGVSVDLVLGQELSECKECQGYDELSRVIRQERQERQTDLCQGVRNTGEGALGFYYIWVLV